MACGKMGAGGSGINYRPRENGKNNTLPPTHKTVNSE